MDRRKIESWWRWVAIILAVVFLLSFVLLGVGSSSAGNVLLGCEQEESVTEDSYFAQRESFYLAELEKNPNDTGSMIQLAILYGTPGSGRAMEGVEYLNRAITTDPANIEARLVLAEINTTQLNNPQEALRLLEEASVIAPDNPQVFLQLGLVAKQLGENARAIAAWSRFLELSPDDPVADTVRSEISLLETLPPVPVAPEVSEEAAREAVGGEAPAEGGQ